MNALSHRGLEMTQDLFSLWKWAKTICILIVAEKSLQFLQQKIIFI